jgi:hypothetical protein
MNRAADVFRFMACGGEPRRQRTAFQQNAEAVDRLRRSCGWVEELTKANPEMRGGPLLGECLTELAARIPIVPQPEPEARPSRGSPALAPSETLQKSVAPAKHQPGVRKVRPACPVFPPRPKKRMSPLPDQPKREQPKPLQLPPRADAATLCRFGVPAPAKPPGQAKPTLAWLANPAGEQPTLPQRRTPSVRDWLSQFHAAESAEERQSRPEHPGTGLETQAGESCLAAPEVAPRRAADSNEWFRRLAANVRHRLPEMPNGAAQPALEDPLFAALDGEQAPEDLLLRLAEPSAPGRGESATEVSRPRREDADPHWLERSPGAAKLDGWRTEQVREAGTERDFDRLLRSRQPSGSGASASPYNAGGGEQPEGAAGGNERRAATLSASQGARRPSARMRPDWETGEEEQFGAPVMERIESSPGPESAPGNRFDIPRLLPARGPRTLGAPVAPTLMRRSVREEMNEADLETLAGRIKRILDDEARRHGINI